MIPLGGEIFFVIAFLVLHAFFSLAETSILNVRKSRLREMLDNEETPEWQRRRAKTILSLKLHPESFIATVQSGSVFFSFLAATYTTFIAYEHLSTLLERSLGLSAGTILAIAFIIMIVLVTVLDLTFGTLMPNS